MERMNNRRESIRELMELKRAKVHLHCFIMAMLTRFDSNPHLNKNKEKYPRIHPDPCLRLTVFVEGV